MRMRAFVSGILLAGLAGCATGVSGPVEVTRLHLGAPLERGTVTVEPATSNDPSTDLLGFADAVRRQLGQVGYAGPRGDAAAQYVANVAVVRASRAVIDRPLASTTPSAPTTQEPLVTELTVRIKRVTDGTVVWEGRAQTSGAAPAAIAAPRLAAALFRGFPGTSGVTIRVP